ncbi:hypothetical protein [Limnohabitans sp.]|jgi:hypothetical protein|uniref:hypothetical protein n=1 Tax=Limnohabitans sp. TaxID=1907725 RepID=UPI0026092BB3|nr:hypothetical protein [Limnohabitans sp.]
MKNLATLFIATAAAKAMAHDGHGLSGSHWHSTDAWGFVALGAMALAAWFIGRGK